ncbi:MAG TPA: hypothetical protein VMG08_21805 [Allosphingosinicella sp.]|nr:hypothetical protein [Allosphingosinicella sp.]
MSPFELVFAVFGLLLGLAIAEVLGGFSRALKLKRGAKGVRIGWLTPLLGLFVILDLTTFWIVAYDARAYLRADYITLTAVLVIVGIYYLAATLIFPEDPEAWPDFDDWYDRHNRMVLGGMLVANLGSWLGQTALQIWPAPEAAAAIAAAGPAMEEAELGFYEWVTLGGGFAILFLLIALIIIRNRRMNTALLALMTLILVAMGVVESIAWA